MSKVINEVSKSAHEWFLSDFNTTRSDLSKIKKSLIYKNKSHITEIAHGDDAWYINNDVMYISWEMTYLVTLFYEHDTKKDSIQYLNKQLKKLRTLNEVIYRVGEYNIARACYLANLWAFHLTSIKNECLTRISEKNHAQDKQGYIVTNQQDLTIKTISYYINKLRRFYRMNKQIYYAENKRKDKNPVNKEASVA